MHPLPSYWYISYDLNSVPCPKCSTTANRVSCRPSELWGISPADAARAFYCPECKIRYVGRVSIMNEPLWAR